jgi:hypothetical protein
VEVELAEDGLPKGGDGGLVIVVVGALLGHLVPDATRRNGSDPRRSEPRGEIEGCESAYARAKAWRKWVSCAR